MSSEKIKFLSLQMLGVCRIEIGKRAVDLRRKPKQLVKLLALQPGQRLHREQIVELLWTDQESDAAINNLHKCVHAARRAFEPDLVSGVDSKFILTKEGQIILTAPDGLRIDVLDFETFAAEAFKSNDEKLYENALALYAGDLLPEDLYEDWTNERRESLRVTHRKLLHKLAALYESAGKFEQSAAVSRKLLALDELDEDAHRSLMRSLALGGNQRQAVKQFEHCRAVLKKELNVEPENETCQLFEQITAGKFHARAKESRLSSDSNGEKSSASQSLPKTNLPNQLTSFVGRSEEIGEITHLLDAARILTLTGTGGIGKTRLAQKVAAASIEKFADGVWFVELAAIGDASLVARAVAATLGVQEDATRPLIENLREFLRSKQILLIFDNCEQIVAACAALAADLLKNCPELRVLATSREALDTSGEVVWSVPTLSLPTEIRAQIALNEFTGYEAVELFIERARLVNPHFSLAHKNAETVARLCRQLDGIPLAIELAAARVRVLSVEQIAARLDNSLQFLTSGGRTVAPRHRTLRAAIDWSYEILSAPEQAMWRALSVFAGGFTLDAAESICADLSGGDSTLDLLTNLIDKSIVSASGRKAETRYSMLETIRQYAAEKLRQNEEEMRFRALHFDYFLQLAKRAESEFSKPAQREWFERLEIEIGNLRAAFERISSEPQNQIQTLQLANALWHFWQSSGRLEEGRRRFEIALERSDDAPADLRLKALHRLGGLMVLQCDFANAAEIYESGLRISRVSNDKFYTARILANLGFALVNKAEFERAEVTLKEGLQIFRELKNADGIAQTLNGLGSLCYYRNDFAQASEIFEEAVEIYRKTGKEINVLGVLQNLGASAHLQGKTADAEKHLREAMCIAEELGERRWINQTRHVLGYVCNDKGCYAEARKFFADALTLDPEIGGKDNIAQVLEGLACTAAAQSNHFRALKLAAFADFLRGEIKTPRSQTLQKYFDGYWNFTRREFNSEDTKRAVSEDRAMTLDEAVKYALQDE